MSVKEAFGKKIKQARLERGLKQSDIAKVLGYESKSYVSDVENGHFLPQPDKLKKWSRALGMTQKEMTDLLLEARLEDLGLTDPGMTLMFKEVPNMTSEELESVVRAYRAVIKAREAKGKNKS
ncbi:MAG: helix-turn-helix transcriptional regulator [Actinobacteria bacterium]|nr:helix-turn-helix transcriptional regulator [Actinomycetota bacterium]